MRKLFTSVSFHSIVRLCDNENGQWIIMIEFFFYLDHESLYSGRVFGETESSVRAHIEDKMITANIILPDETYHIEVSKL